MASTESIFFKDYYFFKDPSKLSSNSHHKARIPISSGFVQKQREIPSSCFSRGEGEAKNLRFFESKGMQKLHNDDQAIITRLNVLKMCQKDKDLMKVRLIHAEVVEKNLIKKNVCVATSLITTYSKYGAVEEAREVFEKLPERDVVSWSALISGYAQNGLGNEALKCFELMKKERMNPNSVTYISVLKACGIVRSLETGGFIDAEIRKRGLFNKDIALGNALMDMYCKCGALDKAKEVFEKLLVRDVVSWNVLITGYVQHRLGEEALKCFKQMKDESVYPNVVTYIGVLRACGIMKAVEIGEDIAAEVRKQGLLRKGSVIGNTLMDMYSKCGMMEKAKEVFEELPVRDVVSWNVLITGYAQHGLSDEALKCFKKMNDAKVCPNSVTFICILKSCGSVGSLEIGKEIDAEIRKQGLLHKDIVLGNALLDMYSKCGVLEKLQDVFEHLPVRDVVSWNVLIAGYAQHGLGDEALKCFKQMKGAGICPNAITYVCILKACGIVRSLEIGEDIDAAIRKEGLLQNNNVLGNALLDMYSKCGALEKACKVFEELPVRDVVTWNALITGYTNHGLGCEALKCFKQMTDARVVPNVVTYICILKACGIMGILETGKGIDAEIQKRGLLNKDVVLGSALVDMYSKCGALKKAQEVFQKLLVRDAVAWNALLTGYAQLGQANVVLGLYKQMREENVMPDSVTFIVLLNMCSHAGLVEEGERLFDEMCDVYCLSPVLEHYTCMVDLFGRAGHFDKVKHLLEKVPNSSHLPLFRSILASCKKWRNEKLAKWAFEKSVELDEKCAASYVCMGDTYAIAGMQDRNHEF